MTTISNKSQFLKWLTNSDPEFDKKYYKRKYYRPKGQMVHLNGLVLENIEIKERDFECTEFKNCTFKNCSFWFTIISCCTLEDCQFVDCHFTWSKFIDADLFSCTFTSCVILGLELSDIVIRNTVLQDCSEILDLKIRGQRDRIIAFKNCYLEYLYVEPIDPSIKDCLAFNNCLIAQSSFDRINFSEGYFKDCNLSLCRFSSCTFSNTTFQGKNETPGSEFNMIDIRSIINSVAIGEEVLRTLFGIQNSDVKEYLIGLTTKIEFQSIFISYSFEDKRFAKTINEELSRRGILTYLWEKDSQGGWPLKTIMSESVKSKDRVLFIASKSSLKSPACHFELTEGRKKQEKTWEDVLFPIHLDNYLFEVEKDKIRPIKVQEEYWENILELRRMNSLSFEEFVNPETRDSNKYEKQVFRLIKGLRKKN